MLATIHHPITVDRELDLAHADRWQRRLTLRRWYGFVGMQARVARQVPRIVTVSESSRRDIADQLGVAPERMAVVPVGVDGRVFRPIPGVARVPGRIMTTASSDVPMKGLVPLLEALAKVRTERPDAHLVVVGRLREGSTIPAALDRLGLAGAVRFSHDAERPGDRRALREGRGRRRAVALRGLLLAGDRGHGVRRPARARPPAGPCPRSRGQSGVAALLVPPNDPGALAQAILTVLSDEPLAPAPRPGRPRASAERFTWPVTARATAEQYFELLAC